MKPSMTDLQRRQSSDKEYEKLGSISCLFTHFHTGTYISTDTELAVDSEFYSV